MKFKIIITLLFGLFATQAEAKLNVVATLPDFGAIAREIGGDKIKVTVLSRGTEDPHFVDAKPSFIRVLNQADILLEGGAELESGWLPPLVNNARNGKILPGKPGHVKMSKGIRLLDLPTGPVDRSMGDVHRGGNPHYWLDPANGKIMAAELVDVFSRLDTENADFFRANQNKFNERLDAKLSEWKKQMEPYRGTKIVTYHKSYEYFANAFGLEIIEQLEPKPGVEPTPPHINALISRMKSEQVKLLLIEPNRPRRTPEHVAESTGATLVVVPGMVGSHMKVKDYFSVFDYAIAEIMQALKAK